MGILEPHVCETGGAADLAARLLGALPAAKKTKASIGIIAAPEDGSHWESLLAAVVRAVGRVENYTEGRFAFANDARNRR